MPFYAKLFFKRLRHLQYGTLRCVAPDGREFVFEGKRHGPQADFIVRDWTVFKNLMTKWDLGLGEDYIYGLWDTGNLRSLLTLGMKNEAELSHTYHNQWWYRFIQSIKKFVKRNTRFISRKNVEMHYDLGNDFYALWLDDAMVYSSALFDGKKRTLEQAQKAKHKRILDKLGKKPLHILDIGCGWGAFMEEALARGHTITGITLSSEQADFVVQRLTAQIGEGKARVRIQDYRDITDCYDAIVSIGMLEHVGQAYWTTYFETINAHLKPGGKAIIQSIVQKKVHKEERDSFFTKFIFPGGFLPSLATIRSTSSKAHLACQSVFAFGKDYARTLEHWLERFDRNIDALHRLGFDDVFVRKWRFYLISCATLFALESIDVVQVELIKSLY